MNERDDDSQPLDLMSGGLEFETQDNAITVLDRVEASCSHRRQKLLAFQRPVCIVGAPRTQSVVEAIVEDASGHLHIRMEASCIGTPGTLQGSRPPLATDARTGRSILDSRFRQPAFIIRSASRIRASTQYTNGGQRGCHE